ncbi:site-specific integrase [archaeon]|nr:site-specific integrase [archaeon]
MKQNSGSHAKFLSEKDYNRLKCEIKEIRDIFLIKVLYETGCELNELVTIKVKDIVNDSICFDENNNNQRKSSISKNLANNLQKYIIGNWLNENDYLFKTRQSGHISTKRVQQLINDYSIKAGLHKINTQFIRYTHIAHAYQKGIQNQIISKQIGLTKQRVFQIITDLNITSNLGGYNKFFN